jgi:hypothetical protein
MSRRAHDGVCTRGALYWRPFLHAFCFSSTCGTTRRHPLGRGYCPATPPRTFRHASLDSASIAPPLRSGSVCAVLAGLPHEQHELLVFASSSGWRARPVQWMDPMRALDSLALGPRLACRWYTSGSTTRVGHVSVVGGKKSPDGDRLPWRGDRAAPSARGAWDNFFRHHRVQTTTSIAVLRTSSLPLPSSSSVGILGYRHSETSRSSNYDAGGTRVEGTATAGRDRTAVFHVRSATPHCRCTMIS